MSATPISIFKSAHSRAEKFLNIETKGGPKDRDNLRAAVVFAVAAIDAFFNIKIISYLKKQRESNPEKFQMPPVAKKMIRDIIAKRSLGGKEYKDLAKDQKELVDAVVDSSRPSLITHLTTALERESFQGIDKMNNAFQLMGRTPSEIWGRFDSSTSNKVIHKKISMGRRKKVKVGRKIDAKTQLRRLFEKRHLIAHQADIILTGKKQVGDQRKIEYKYVKKWLEVSKESIECINGIIT